MYKEQIEDLISFIKNNSNINVFFEERVFYITPVQDQEGTALYVSILAEDRKLSFLESLVEFRIVSSDYKNGPFEIQNIVSIIRDEFEKNGLEIGNFRYHQINTGSDIFIGVNTKSNYEGVFTMIFKISR